MSVTTVFLLLAIASLAYVVGAVIEQIIWKPWGSHTLELAGVILRSAAGMIFIGVGLYALWRTMQ